MNSGKGGGNGEKGMGEGVSRDMPRVMTVIQARDCVIWRGGKGKRHILGGKEKGNSTVPCDSSNG